MPNHPFLTRYLPLACSALLLVSCGTVGKIFPDKKADYKNSQTAPSLEVPPDLNVSKTDDSLTVPAATTGDAATLSTYSQTSATPQAAGGSSVLPAQDKISVERDGDKRWLVIKADSAAVWTKMREFWLENGFLIKREDPHIGILETDWAENRADIPMDPVRKILSKAVDSLYSAPTRDMFRVRLEPGATAGTTELYISHRGMQEVVNDKSTIWQSRPSDPELESEMLGRMMEYMGVHEQQAKVALSSAVAPPPRAQLIRAANGTAVLNVDEDISRAWRRTGLALDRVGFSVEDRDRSKGVYFVTYDDPLKDTEKKGFLSKLAFWKEDSPADQTDKYQVMLASEGSATRITVLDKDGKQVTNKTGERILTLLQEQLK